MRPFRISPSTNSELSPSPLPRYYRRVFSHFRGITVMFVPVTVTTSVKYSVVPVTAVLPLSPLPCSSLIPQHFLTDCNPVWWTENYASKKPARTCRKFSVYTGNTNNAAQRRFSWLSMNGFCTDHVSCHTLAFSHKNSLPLTKHARCETKNWKNVNFFPFFFDF